ncbi:spermidine synthase [Serratia rubidaea]|uniref:spermidine synthase n=1 Tax=Serratia rubidaea TaxID=61652 RepID=UPI00177EBF49|nr:fused MFS/spermidine synthase [Serratia rubidaea]MBD8453665.1 fused MFS/spermidine synthase [Serratia rubidaea]MDC6109290.1 fused MFS/spermidine synthase [Serratia rubidaea]UJD81826.1 spermidine synthase [Serratia rubidaea]UJD86389.1 spermidine synthase [Serratia rubidaea]
MTRIVDDILQTLLDRDPPGQEIHREADEYGDIIVTEHKQYRMLRFDELYEQSKVSMRAPASPIHHYIKAMLMAIAWREEGDVLLLGLGGGSLLRALHAYDPDRRLDVVELRSRVLAVARSYFTLPEAGCVNYHIDDAGRYLRRVPMRRYGFIFSDLYSAFSMSPQQGTEAFLERCRDALCDGGWLVLNYLEMPHSQTLLYHALYRVFTDVFFCETGSGNVVIYASYATNAYRLQALQTQALRLSRDGVAEVSHLARYLTRL